MSSLASLPIPAQTALLLVASNVFMTFAWYGHLRNLASAPWYVAALVSWGIALFEYLLQVPANRIGHHQLFSVGQLKIMQEVITLAGVRAVRLVLPASEPLQARLPVGRRCAWWARCTSSFAVVDLPRVSARGRVAVVKLAALSRAPRIRRFAMPLDRPEQGYPIHAAQQAVAQGGQFF
jgi:uncharacterized protein (DUF486 family)